MPLLLAGNLKAELQSAIINTYQPDFLYHSTTPESSAPQFTLTARANSPTVLHPDLALLLSTSGSTGSPKVVHLSASNLQSNATAIAHYFPGLGDLTACGQAGIVVSYYVPIQIK